VTVEEVAAANESFSPGEYNGDLNSAPETSNSLVQAIQQTTTVALSSNNPLVIAGVSVTFTAVVSGQSVTPSGTVIFLDGASPLGTGTSDASGHASFSSSSLGLGTHSVSALYAGDANSLGVASLVFVQIVQETTATSLTSSNNPSQTGVSVTLTATVTPAGSGTPTGSVTFLDGTTSLGTATLTGSLQATFAITSLSNGTHSITAVYAGDSSFAGSSSTALSETIYVPTGPAPTITMTVVEASAHARSALKSSTKPSLEIAENTPITIAAVVSAGGVPVTQGTVTFLDGTVTIGGQALSSTGTASTITVLGPGSHQLSSTYNGSGSASANTSISTVVMMTPTISSALTDSGAPGNYTLTSIITAMRSISQPAPECL
jgi:hypothetical protein